MTIRVLVWNVQGALGRKCRDEDFAGWVFEYDIIILVETHLAEGEGLGEVSGLEDFFVVRADRKGAKRSSGGVMLLIRKEVKNECGIQGRVHEGLVVFEIPTGSNICSGRPLTVVGGYAVPETSARRARWARDERERVWQTMEDFVAARAGLGDILIVGDLNARVANRSDILAREGHGVTWMEWAEIEWPRLENPDRELNDNGRRCLELCRTYGLLVANGRVLPPEFTRYEKRGGSVPDTWMGTLGALRAVRDGRVWPLSIFSDHTPMTFELAVNSARNADEAQREVEDIYPVMVRSSVTKVAQDAQATAQVRDALQQDEAFLAMAARLEILNQRKTVLGKAEVTEIAAEFYGAVQGATQGWVRWTSRNKKIGGNGKQFVQRGRAMWWCRECGMLKRSFKQARRVVKRAWRPGHDQLHDMWEARRAYKDHLRHHKRECDRGEWNGITELLGDGKRLWQRLRLRLCCDYDGPLEVDEVTEHYAAINAGQYDHDEGAAAEARRMLDAVYWEEVGGEDLADYPIPSGIWKVGTGKAAGADGWVGEFLSVLRPVLQKPVENLLRIILRAGETPEAFDHDIKKPFAKAGKAGDQAKDLRPVTLLNELLKMLERWIKHLWSEQHQGDEAQAGFKKNYSCVGRLFVLTVMVIWNLHHEKKQLHAVLVDFSSFFESIRHDQLLVKMIKGRIRRRLVRMFRGLYRHARCRVLLKGRYGREFGYSVGVRQGSVWSPDLGAFYVEDIIVVTRQVSDGAKVGEESIVCMFYADDLVLLDEDPLVMQMLLDALAVECRRVGLDVNVAKTVHTVFRRSTRGQVRTLEFAGMPVQFVSDVVLYLGGKLRHDGSLSPHRKHRAARGERALGATMTIWKRFPCMTLSFQLVLADSLVGSVLRYAEELWAWEGGPEIDRVDATCLRRACGVSSQVAAAAVRWVCGRLPIEVSCWRAAYKFWAKIRAMDTSRYERVALEAAWRLHSEHRIGWIHDMLAVFVRVGFVQSWAATSVLQTWGAEHIQAKMREFVAAAERYAQESLRSKLARTDSKYGFLLLVHSQFGAADVCAVSWPWVLRKALLKMLLSDHNLRIEIGRYQKPPLAREDRVCLACARQGIMIPDDEKHALDDCRALAAFREKFWEAVCRDHLGNEWRERGVTKLLSELKSFDLRVRRQVWHALAVFSQSIFHARHTEGTEET